MNGPSWLRRLSVLDVESTGVNVEADRIVQAAWVDIEGKESAPRTWLVNPGIEIPQGAIDVHGISNERARAEGLDPAGVVRELVGLVETAAATGTPVVAMNATYDLTMLDREARRHLGRGVDFSGLAVIDPMVLDRACDVHRNHVKGGKRRLSELARHYRCRQEGAHDALADCLTTARVLWRIAQTYRHIREMDLSALMAFQVQANLAWAINTERYLRTSGRPDAVVDASWPYCPSRQEGAQPCPQ